MVYRSVDLRGREGEEAYTINSLAQAAAMTAILKDRLKAPCGKYEAL